MTLLRKVFSKNLMYVPVFSLLALGAACELYEDGTISQEQIQVHQDRFSEQIALADMDAQTVKGIAAHYDRYGDGAVGLSVTYDPSSRSYTSLDAGDSAAALAKEFRKNGISNITPTVLPAPGEGKQVLISFDSYSAEAPKDCGLMPGLKDPTVNQDHEYKLGCSVKTMVAQQVSRPKDLLGRGQENKIVDGRRVANSVEAYRDGVPNEPLEGESASGE